MPTSPLLDQGIKLFNRGMYFEAHEVWEDLWRETDGPLRNFYQGLIHAAVGLYHLRQENATGARIQLGKSLARLGAYPGECEGIDNAGLMEELAGVRERLEAQGIRILRVNDKDGAKGC